jgi:hypothetical protein
MSAPQSLLSLDPPAQEERSGGDPAAGDLPALRLVRVPDWGAPFDGDPAAGDIAAWAGGQFGCDWAAAGAGAQPTTGSQPKRAAGEAPRLAAAEQLAASSQWAQQFARLLAEALSGARPVRQILPWTSERARGHLDRLAPLFGGGQRPRVLRVITTRPTLEVIEMTVIVGVGTRTRALAIRLEQAALHRLARPAEYATRAGTSLAGAHRWVCTDIEAA